MFGGVHWNTFKALLDVKDPGDAVECVDNNLSQHLLEAYEAGLIDAEYFKFKTNLCWKIACWHEGNFIDMC